MTLSAGWLINMPSIELADRLAEFAKIPFL